MASPMVQRFLTLSGELRMPQARRQWRLTHVESRDDACMLCGRATAMQYGITHRNGTMITLDRACVLHYIYLPGVTSHRSKSAVLHHLTQKYMIQETLYILGSTALMGPLTPSQQALLIKTLARTQHWQGPVSAHTIQRAWPQIVPLLTRVSVQDLGEDDQARLWTLLVPPPVPAPTPMAQTALRTVS